MAEYKHYITNAQEWGSVMISEEVVATIAEQALADVEGAALLREITNWNRGMKILIAEDNSVSISVNITVAYGQSVVSVAKNVQAVIATAVENMTGVKISEVNVNICGVSK